jgi:hypothetical protein
MSRIHDHHGTARSEGAAGAPLGDSIRLPLVKREHTIGPATYLDPIYGFLRVVAIPATSYRCLHCEHLLRADFWSGNVRLGPGVRRCAQCSEEYDDGSREWPQLSFANKVRFCCPPILAGISGGMVVASIVVVFLPQPDWRVAVIGLIFAFIPVFLFFLVRLPWVLLSIRRYNNHGKTSSL